MKSAKTVIAILALIFVSFVVYKNYGAVKSGVDLDNFNQDDGRVMAPVDLMLTVGETAEATGLSLTFNSIVQDDRCPSDAKCQEGGAVTVSLTLTTDNQTETLNYSSDGVPLSFGGYNIAIVEVMPKLLLNTEISPNDYIVTFNVSSAYTDIVDNPDVAGGTVPTGSDSCESIGGTLDATNGECLGIGANACQEIGGTFNECASACRNDPSAEVCTMQCVQVCEV